MEKQEARLPKEAGRSANEYGSLLEQDVIHVPNGYGIPVSERFRLKDGVTLRRAAEMLLPVLREIGTEVHPN